MPTPPGAPGGPGQERGGRFRPPPEGRGPGEPPRGQIEEPDDPKRIRIDLRQIRRELFDELVADREAFDALPLEEKQKVFAQIEQRMAGVAQGIKVLQQELATRAVEVRTQDTAGSRAGSRSRRVRCRDAAGSPGARSASGTRCRAGPPPRRADRACRPRPGRACRRCAGAGETLGVRDEAIDADVGQASRRQGRARWPGRRTGERRRRHAEAARDGVRDDVARSR